MFRISPKAIIIVTIEVPPKEIKGRGIPTTGRIPLTIPIFTKT
jgi:hypothetical protein